MLLRTRLSIALLLSGLRAPAALAEAERPVVAVFGIEDKTGQLRLPAIQQLSDYLNARVAAGGAFQIVPASSLKVGAGLRVLIPITRSLLSESSGLYPGVTILATLPIGWAALP